MEHEARRVEATHVKGLADGHAQLKAAELAAALWHRVVQRVQTQVVVPQAALQGDGGSVGMEYLVNAKRRHCCCRDVRCVACVCRWEEPGGRA